MRLWHDVAGNAIWDLIKRLGWQLTLGGCFLGRLLSWLGDDQGPEVLDCPTTLKIGPFFVTGTSTHRDYPFVKNGTEIAQDAHDGAVDAAREQARVKIAEQVAMFRCAAGCEMAVSDNVTIRRVVRVGVSRYGIYDAYTYTATARVTITIACKKTEIEGE